MKSGAFPSSPLRGDGEEACTVDHKAVPYLSCGSCMSLTGRRNMHTQWNRGFSCNLGWGSKFHSLLKTLPQITWEKCVTFFSGYKPVSRHCLFLMSCLFCTCLQMGQLWVPEHFSPFLMLMTGAEWACLGTAGATLRAHSVFFLLVQSSLMRKFWLCSKVCVD